MIFLSEQDVDTASRVQCWLRRQPEEVQNRLASWLEDYFMRAIDATMEGYDLVLSTTRMGVVDNALSHISGCTSKGLFCRLCPFLCFSSPCLLCLFS